MPYIQTIPYNAATGKLRRLYDRIKGPDNNVDNIMMLHSLRPHSMEGHMVLYKNVLHHSGNTVPKWFLEVLGVWVSSLNSCAYCVEHHFSGLRRLLNDDARAQQILTAIQSETPHDAGLDAAQVLALQYAELLTRHPAKVTLARVQDLRDAGYEDGEILEINQVVAYFNYANRTVLGLGCSTKGDIIGLSPGHSDDAEDWGHV